MLSGRERAKRSAETKNPPLRRAQVLSFAGTAASVMDGRLLCVCAQSLADYKASSAANANTCQARRFTSIVLLSRSSNASPSSVTPISVAARLGLTGFT